jgi:hypothetical protein
MSSFFKKKIPKPFFRIKNNSLVLHGPEERAPNSELERLDFFRNISGYSHFIDYVFRSINLKYWWGISAHADFPKRDLTGENSLILACSILNEMSQLLSRKNIKLFLVSQTYFREAQEPNSKDHLVNLLLESCITTPTITAIPFSLFLNTLHQSHFSEYSSLFVRPKSHMSARGNELVAEMVYNQLIQLK